RIRKGRWRRWGRVIFKQFWPSRWSPPQSLELYAQCVGLQERALPDLGFLTKTASPLEELRDISREFFSKGFLAVMPSSRWEGKEWGVEKFFELLDRLAFPVIVLGTASDR